MTTHAELLAILQPLPTDYKPWGGIEQWADDTKAYPDCSCGCRFFVQLEGRLGADWGVCSNPNAPRRGLLTFEHQAGFGCFVEDTET